MALQFTTSYVSDSLSLYRYYKRLADTAMARVTDEQFHAALDPEMNSIAVIVHHIAGNMLSRWTDFLTSDGEKPDRDRDGEFAEPPSRAVLMQMWEDGWARTFAALEPLTDSDLGRSIKIRGETHSIMQAINRNLTHTTHHIGQIVLLAKHFQHTEWKSLSIPRGESAGFREKVKRGELSQR